MAAKDTVTKVPKNRQYSFWLVIPQLTVLVILVLGFSFLGYLDALLLGAAVYYLLFLGLRRFVSSDHRRAMKLFSAGNYLEAIPQFEKSYAFFNEHKWVDNFRTITLFSTSLISYREIALANIAYSYAKENRTAKAREVYERMLTEFPNSIIAEQSLKVLNAKGK